MQLLGRDANLGAQAEHAAVGKARRGVHIYGRRVHSGKKCLGGGIVTRHNALRVARAVPIDVLDSLFDTVDNLAGQLKREILAPPVLLLSGNATRKTEVLRNLERRLITMDQNVPFRTGTEQHGKKLCGACLVDKHGLARVAHAGP